MKEAEPAVIEMTVNETIRRYPRTVEVFNRHGIDACCGGSTLVWDAALRDGADIDALLRDLLTDMRETS